MNQNTSVRTIAHLLLSIGLSIVFAACQPVPRPFSSTQKGDFSAVQLGPRAGTVVLPIIGATSDETGRQLAAAVAKALRRHDVTAGIGTGHSRSHRLQGTAQHNGGSALQLIWTLRDADGVEAFSLTLTDEITPAGWDRADPTSLDRIAARAADAIDRRLRRQERGDGRRVALAPVNIGPIDGAPDRGGERLAAAMKLALAEAGVPLSRDPLEDGFILLGSVHLGAQAADGSRRIEIVWHLIRPDGDEFGKVSQANRVTATHLAGDWRELAQAIAQAGAPGVLELLRQDPGG